MNAAINPAAAPLVNPTVSPMGRWARLVKALPVTVGLLLVAGVWAAGAVWSFSEQRDFAGNRGFDLPALLPLTIDGLALSLAVVAWSAALDGRAAMQARLGTFVAIAASAASNATWAATRTHGDGIAVTLAAGVPLAAAVAFETLLAELRKGVHRRRGLPAPVAVAAPRVIRLVLAPWPTFRDWRAHVLTLTAPNAAEAVTGIPAHVPAAEVQPDAEPEPEPVAEVERVADPASELPEAKPGGRRPGRPGGRSLVAARVLRLAEQHPDWTAVQIAAKAGCTDRTVRRHLNRSPDPSEASEAGGLTPPTSHRPPHTSSSAIREGFSHGNDEANHQAAGCPHHPRTLDRQPELQDDRDRPRIVDHDQPWRRPGRR